MLALSAAPASAAPGDPVNQLNFDLKEVALQSGKTIMAGTADNSDLALIRLIANGDPDPSFDTEGFVRADFGAVEQAADLALAPGGRLVVAGTHSPGATPVAVLAGFNSDGSPDTSFSGDGRATLLLAPNDVVSSVEQYVVAEARPQPLTTSRAPLAGDPEGRVPDLYPGAPEPLGHVAVSLQLAAARRGPRADVTGQVDGRAICRSGGGGGGAGRSWQRCGERDCEHPGDAPTLGKFVPMAQWRGLAAGQP